MNRVELQSMTRERILDAQALIRGKRWSFAYDVAGCAVQCALKSCLLARMIHTGWIFEDKARIDQCLTHDFGKLIRLAGLTDDLNTPLGCRLRPTEGWMSSCMTPIPAWIAQFRRTMLFPFENATPLDR